MPLSTIALLLAAEAPSALVANAARLTTAEPRCTASANSTDVTVCGLRRADRYRVPLVVRDAGDPRYEAVAAERERLLHRTTPVQDLSPFLVGGGMAGVHVSTATGVTGTTGRKLAP